MDRGQTLGDLFEGMVRDHDVRARFAEDPDGFLGASGFGDLPSELVAEAVVHYADAAPLEVAEQLSPFVVAHSPVGHDEPMGDPGDALVALAGVGWEEPASVGEVDDPGDDPEDLADPDDLAFGAGGGQGAPQVDPVVDDEEVELEDLAEDRPSAVEIGHDPVDLDDMLGVDVDVDVDVEEMEEPETPEDDWGDVI